MQAVRIRVATPEPTTHQDESTTSRPGPMTRDRHLTCLISLTSHNNTFWWKPLSPNSQMRKRRLSKMNHCPRCWTANKAFGYKWNPGVNSQIQAFVRGIRKLFVAKVSKNAKFLLSQNIPPVVWWWVSSLHSKFHGFLSLGLSERIFSQDSHLLDCCGKSEGWLK